MNSCSGIQVWDSDDGVDILGTKPAPICVTILPTYENVLAAYLDVAGTNLTAAKIGETVPLIADAIETAWARVRPDLVTVDTS